MTQSDIIRVLSVNGNRATVQRRIIIEILISKKDYVLSAESIYKKASKISSSINLSTVYRNLELFESLNIVHRIAVDNSDTLYCVNSIDEHHHHIICKNCGRTETITFCPYKKINDEALKKDFILTDLNLNIYGYCKKCSINK